MESRKITKTDKGGKRLFVEIGRGIKDAPGLPKLKKEDRMLLLPQRNLTKSELEKLIGQYISFFIDEGKDLVFYEGILRKNEPKFWKNQKMLEGDYVLLDCFLDEEEPILVLDLDDINHYFDLQVITDAATELKGVECYNPKCKKKFSISFKYCPHCGKHNPEYTKNKRRFNG